MRRSPFAVLLAFAACSVPAPTGLVVHGGMREVMRDGHTEARVALADHASRGSYGVGALAGLQGEVWIDDGEVLVARDDVRRVGPPDPGTMATLLVVARVPAWRDVCLPDAVDEAGLEAALLAAVPGAGDESAPPLPIRIAGTASQLDLHVVRGHCPHGAPVAGSQPPARWSVPDGTTAAVRLVGVFARGREGLLTHHGTGLHVHALVGGAERVMGHVDGFRLLPGAVVQVPADR